MSQALHPRYIMELLGRASINLTMDRYGHVLEEMKRETTRQTDAVFDSVAVKMAGKESPAKVN